MDIIARMAALAAQLDAHPSTRAYHDPAKALENRPCLLVAPPAIDWTEGSWGAPRVRWGIVALSSHPAGTLDAVKELNALVQAADAVLDIETATPTRYTLTSKGDPVAAYMCTHTEIED